MAVNYVEINKLKVDNPGQPNEVVYPYGESDVIAIDSQGEITARVDCKDCSLIVLVYTYKDAANGEPASNEFTHAIWPYPAQEGLEMPKHLDLPAGAKVRVRAYLGRTTLGRTGYARVNLLTNPAP